MLNKIHQKWAVFTIVILASGYSALSLAGDERGNGGDVVSCVSIGQPHPRSLDYYEAETRFGLTIDTSTLPGDEWQKARTIIDRLEKLDPARHKTYVEWLGSFWSETSALSGVTLVDIPDSNHIAIPAGCSIVQLINQKVPQFGSEKRYTLNLDVWQTMDASERAGIILHEIILREAVANRHLTSNATRYFNGVLASSTFPSFQNEAHLRLLIETNFPKIGPIFINGLEYEGWRPGESSFSFVFDGESELRLSKIDQTMFVGGVSIPLRGGTVLLSWPDFSVKRINSWLNEQDMSFPIASPHTIVLDVGSGIGFFGNNGTLNCGTTSPSSEQMVPWIDGTVTILRGRHTLRFNDAGYAVKVDSHDGCYH